MGFSVWDQTNTALGWDDTLTWFALWGIEPVPELYRGIFDEKRLDALIRSLPLDRHEGVVMRLAGPIAYEDFGSSVAKWVRPEHVQTTSHWMHQRIVPNGLRCGAPDSAGAIFR